MKQVIVEIKGINPLLIQRFTEESQQSKTSRKSKISGTVDTRAVALHSANKKADGTHYISAFAIINAMCATGGNHKMTGTRKTVRFLVPSAVKVQSDDCTITILCDNCPATDTSIEVDARPVTIPATKGRIMRYRPRYEKWSMKFLLEIQDDLLDLSLCHQLLSEAGVQIGIGDFRPEKRGPFGSFRVVKWEEIQ